MRIHRLEIQAFGPFADRQVIDFDELGAQGLFLLNGPTGAGKTSVLDAICFALYGSVPGARQEARKLRSDHAAPGTVPEVVLDFSAGPRRFEVVRNPQWDRPAKRAGSARGTVTEQARTLLRELVHGEWVQKTARNDEAAVEIQALLGMSREQFTRVVMLPQGDFAAFLRADATSRADLLQRLFGTWRFEEIEQQLKDQTDAARAELEKAGTAAELLRAQARNEVLRCAKLLGDKETGAAGPEQGTGTEAAAGLELDPADAAVFAPEEDDGAAWLESVRTVLAERLNSLRDKQAESSTVLATAEESLHRVQARRARGLALLQLEADEREHARRLAASLPRRETLAAHDRAEVLAGYLSACSSAARSSEKAADGARTALMELSEAAESAGLAGAVPAAGDPAVASPDPGWLDQLEERTATELTASAAALAEAERAAALALQAAAERVRETSLREEAEAAGTAAGELRAEQDGLRAGLPLLRSAAAGIESARARMHEAVRLREVIAEFKRAREAAVLSAESAAAARQRYQDQREHWQGLQQLRLDQAAAELAAGLAEGVGCPVCGSTSHPAPAPLPAGGSLVTREEESAARLLTEAAEKEWEASRSVATADASAVSILRGQGGASDPEAAATAGEGAENDFRAAEQAAERLAADEERLQELDAQIAALTARGSELLQRAAQAQARAEAAEEEAAELLRDATGPDQGPEALRRRLDLLRTLRRLTSTARSALQAAELASAARAVSDQALQAALQGTGFADAGAVQAALLPRAEAVELRAELEALDAEAARLAMRRENEDAAAALDSDGEPVAMPDEEDVAEAAEAAEAARRAVADGAVQIGLVEGSASALEDLAVRLGAAEEEIRPLRSRHELLQSVSDTARGNGENNYRMALSTYVLAARLEQVAAAATERLAAMTAGRYSLVHDDSRSGNRKAGLGLHVIDAWTGVRRDTSTLSGGESFMASLALALGLADVVQAESGGTSMETLFVDEGFGSLDEEALEQVMDALEGLRDGGRVVGLVSHVAEMKQRIGAQLQITRGRNGSTLRFRAADALPV